MVSESAKTLNQAAFNSRAVVRDYTIAKHAFAAEDAIFARLRSKLTSPAVLDIGVGAGRTTNFFQGWASSYIGVDIAELMIKSAKLAFPDRTFYTLNARNIDQIVDPNSLDLVLFSFNGLDYLPHTERLEVLAKIRQSLKPTGYFIMSSHQLTYGLKHRGFRLYQIPFSLNPIRLAISTVRILKRNFMGYINYCRNHKLEEVNNEYAILNDWAHEFALLTYYIDPTAQHKQLIAAGFDGSTLETWNPFCHEPDQSISQASWLYYVCRPAESAAH